MISIRSDSERDFPSAGILREARRSKSFAPMETPFTLAITSPISSEDAGGVESPPDVEAAGVDVAG